jgi:hypothetical protein
MFQTGHKGSRVRHGIFLPRAMYLSQSGSIMGFGSMPFSLLGAADGASPRGAMSVMGQEEKEEEAHRRS